MKDLTYIQPQELRKWSETEGAGRKLRDFEYYDIQNYIAAGQTSLEFFRTDGQQQDISGAPGTITRMSNMVTSGKFDEPFLLMGISVLFLPYDTTQTNQIIDTLNVLRSGRIVLEINNVPVFWRTPIGRCGSPFKLEGYSVSSAASYGALYNALPPATMNPYIYCKEGITVKANMYWSTVVALAGSTVSNIGIYLHGAKFFKI